MKFFADSEWETSDSVLLAIESMAKTKKTARRIWADPKKTEGKKIIKILKEKGLDPYEERWGCERNWPDYYI
jgi:ribosomal protein RSM22 (predicted rRNA methylase)